MRYKKIAQIQTTDQEVLKYLSEKYIVTAEDEQNEKKINYFIIKDTEPPPPPPEPEPPKKKTFWDYFKVSE